MDRASSPSSHSPSPASFEADNGMRDLEIVLLGCKGLCTLVGLIVSVAVGVFGLLLALAGAPAPGLVLFAVGFGLGMMCMDEMENIYRRCKHLLGVIK